MMRALFLAWLLLPLSAAPPAARAASAVPPAAATPSAAADVPDLKVRGTVMAVDPRRGAFTLRVSGHDRTVYVTPDTDTSALGPDAADRFPVARNQRVSVGGALQPDGSVLAALLTPSRRIAYVRAPGQPDRILFGHISSRSGRLRGRDIKIRLANGTETKIRVARGILIRRAGRPISVHDLKGDDDIRVVGTRDRDDLRAARIDVLAPLPSPPPSPLPAQAVGRDGAGRVKAD